MRLSAQRGFSGINEIKKLQNAPEGFSFMRNMRITESGSVERRNIPIVLRNNLGGTVEGMWSGSINGTEMVVYSCAGELCRIVPSVSSVPEFIGFIDYGECMMFEFNGLLYVKNQVYYGKYDGTTLTEVEGYIPTIAISCNAEGEGVAHEQLNLICDKRRQIFSGDGSSRIYYLAESGVAEIISINLDGAKYKYQYVLTTVGNGVSFEVAPTEGLNNLEIVYRKTNPASDRNRIMGCTKVLLFGGNSDGRAFLWGNSDHPNYRFHSELADGVPSVEYFPVNNYTVIGNSKINCIVQQYNRQLIFNDNEAYYSYCELKEDTLGNVISSFPVFSLNNGKGCLCEIQGCVIDNKPVTLCDDGLNMWESTSLQDEKNAVCFSMPISESIGAILRNGISNIHLFDFQANRELYFICGEIAFVYNYGIGCWYRFDMFSMDSYTVLGSTLYYASGRTLYTYGNHIGEGYDLEREFQTCYITSGKNSGRSDITGVEADVYIKGPVRMIFSVEKSEDGSPVEHTFEFDESVNKFIRIAFRPSLKRAMPFRVNLFETGRGSATLHGISITTREKERSNRIGLQ